MMAERQTVERRSADAIDRFCSARTASRWERGVTALRRRAAWLRARAVLGFTYANWFVRVVKPGMLVLAGVVFYAFSQLTAAQEVFAASAELAARAETTAAQLTIVLPTVLVLLLLSVLLFLSQQQFSRMRSSQYADSIPRRFIQFTAPMAGFVAVVTTASPWIAAAFGYWSAEAEFNAVKLSVGVIADNFGHAGRAGDAPAGSIAEAAALIRQAAPEAPDFERQAANLAWAMASLGVVLVLLFNMAPLALTPRDRAVRFRSLRLSGLRVAALFFVAIALAPLLAPQPTLALLLGETALGTVDPVAIGATAVFFTIGFFIAIGLAAYRIGAPSFAVFAVVVALALLAQSFPGGGGGGGARDEGAAAPEPSPSELAKALADDPSCAWLRRPGEIERPAAAPEAEAAARLAELETRLHAWLCARSRQDPTFARGGADETGGSAREPVFVLAARGGGAYAAIATTTLLARLDGALAGDDRPGLSLDRSEVCAAEAQDAVPLPFTSRLFAVVGVSGGAVGAAVNRALIEDGAPRCALEGAARRVLTAGHISAVFGMLGADIARKFWPWRGDVGAERYDRAGALEKSLETAYLKELAALGLEPAEPGADAARAARICDSDATVCRPFLRLAAEPGAPALLFNTTSSTLGYRVAFTPIRLAAVGDGTLIAFEEFAPALASAELNDVSLIRAAVASARFPGITPAFTVGKADSPTDRFNFVDGGFADSTGATTALEIVEQLETLSAVYPIEPHLIVIADRDQRGDGPPRERGSPLADIGATADAVLTIRSLLSRRALQRVETYFEREGLRDRLHVIEFERDSFNLPLGWRLSETMATMLALQIGWPGFADAFRRDRDSAPLHSMSDVILNNSCELSRIRRAVSPITAPAPPPSCACAGVGGFCGEP